MKFLSLVVVLCAGLLIPARMAAQLPDPIADFPLSFSDKAMVHVSRLQAFGIPVSGTPAAVRTVDYIAREFRKAGLEVTKDTFSYRYFDLRRKTAEFDGNSFLPKNIVYNPYDGIMDYRGSFVFFYPDSAELRQINQGFENRIIVTKESANIVRLAYKQPRAILVYEKKIFDSLVKMKPGELFLRLEGSEVRVPSVNVTATLKPAKPDSSSVILMAHWDGYTGRNAGDNATGVATLIELARWFAERRSLVPVTLKFVATGAGEMGMLGAISYAERHAPELPGCMLAFSIDGITGLHDIYMEASGGVESIPKVKGRITHEIYWKGCAIRGLNDDWIWLGDIPMASNVTKKLRNDIISTCNALFLRINQVSGMGSDHQVFALAGVPATCISIEDEPASGDPASIKPKIHPEGLWMAGRIAAGVVVATLKKE